MTAWRVPFGDLRRRLQRVGPQLHAAAARVIDSGWYVLGREVGAFEQEWADVVGTAHAVGVASGADALYLALAACDIGPGDEVITVANACMYEAAAIIQTGARPIFVDVDPVSQNMNPAALHAAISARTRAVMPVHLFGRPAAMAEICAIAAANDLVVIEDAAQAHLAFTAVGNGPPQMVGSWGAIAAFSFYPSKNLGALGDAGALTTNDGMLAERLRRLRMYGWSQRYLTTEHGGRNSRLDEIQAALLRVNLELLQEDTALRRERAAWYCAGLAGLPLQLPPDEAGHVYHLFVITLPDRTSRDALQRHLHAHGIGAEVHYPTPTHLQPAYRELGFAPGSLPVTEDLAGRILSLPLYPELSRAEIDLVIETVHAGVGR